MLGRAEAMQKVLPEGHRKARLLRLAILRRDEVLLAEILRALEGQASPVASARKPSHTRLRSQTPVPPSDEDGQGERK
jgi:hypothetical protein